MFFMQLLKITLPHKRCFEIGTSDIPSAILFHSSPTGFSWCPAWKTMAEEFSCFKTANRQTKCKEGFFVCLFSWWGLFLAELSFQTESYEGQDRADCCLSIALFFFWACLENYYTCFWTYKSHFEKNIWWMQEMVILLLLLAIPQQHHGLNCVL